MRKKGLLILALMLMIMLYPAAAFAQTVTVSPYTGNKYTHSDVFKDRILVNGIDVSAYQNNIDWNRVKADGIDFAIIRVGGRGYGAAGKTYIDGYYRQNIENAKKAGVMVGIYYFSQAITEAEAIEEANITLELLGSYDIELPIFMDYEYAKDDANPGRLITANLSKEQATANAEAFCKTIEAAGHEAGIYANLMFLNDSIDGKALGEKYFIWEAQYNNQSTYQYTYDMWQYSSSGNVSGIGTRTDCDFWYLNKMADATQDKSIANCQIRIENITYSAGKNHEPAVEVTYNGKSLKKGVDYKIGYINNNRLGTAYAFIKGIGEYTDYQTVPFEISKIDISGKAVNLAYSDTKYDGTAKKPEVTIDGLKKDIDYTVSYKDNVKAGTATVTVQGIGNYEGSITKTFEISKADISEKTVTLAYSSIKYDGTAKTPEVTIAGLKKDVDYTAAYKDNLKVGTATVTVQGIGNYAGTVTKTFEISKADISGKTVTLAYSITKYDGTAKTPEVTIAGFKKDVDYTVAYKDNLKVGTATVTVKGIGNCTGTITRTFTIVAGSDSLLGNKTKLRIYGPSRYETSIETAKALKTSLGIDKFNCIIVADGRGYADALAGAYLVKVKTAPILVVGDDAASQKLVKEYIVNNLNKNGTVYILGGTGAVSGSFEKSISGDSRKVKRLGGKDRYSTNLLILKEAGVGNEDILVCSGMGFADSLSASAVGKPILLVGNSLNSTQKSYLNASGKRNYYIIGGTGAVSYDVERELKGYGSIKRVSGQNRYATSVAVARQFFGNYSETAVFAYGLNFPDGLSGGPLAMSLEGPLLLVTSTDTPAAASYIKSSGIKKAVTLGGPALISDAAVKKILSE